MELLITIIFIAGVIIAIRKNSSIEDKGCHPIEKDVILLRRMSSSKRIHPGDIKDLMVRLEAEGNVMYP